MRILVLDIGSHSVKALYFERKYRGCNIVNFSNTVIEKNELTTSASLMSETIAKIIKENSYQPDSIAVMYPAEKLTQRFVTLPFRDARRISLSLPLELEEELPFDIKNIVYDWETIESRGRNSRVFVSATKKEDIEQFKAMLKDAGIDPYLIIPGYDPYTHLANFLKLGREHLDVEKNGISTKEQVAKPIILVDLGCSKTTMLIVRNGMPEELRVINYGGNHITKKIMERYELSYDEAERSKIEVGYIVMDGDASTYSEEQQAFSKVIRDAAETIIRDINQTIASYKTEKKEAVVKCLLTGSGWKTRNFREYMEQELRIPVEPIEYSVATGLKLPFAGTAEETNFTSLLGFFIRNINKSGLKGLDFIRVLSVKGGPAELQDYYTVFKPTIRTVVIGVLIFLLYAVGHNFILNRIQSRYNGQLETKFKTAFPDKDKRSQNLLLGNMERLSKEIDVRMRLQKDILEGGADKKGKELSSLTILRDLSALIPVDYTLDVTDLEIKDKNLKIKKIIIPANSTPEKLSEILENSKKFEAVKLGEIKQLSGGAGREFELSATYKGGA